jgi:hypothetical protein
MVYLVTQYIEFTKAFFTFEIAFGFTVQAQITFFSALKERKTLHRFSENPQSPTTFHHNSTTYVQNNGIN